MTDSYRDVFDGLLDVVILRNYVVLLLEFVVDYVEGEVEMRFWFVRDEENGTLQRLSRRRRKYFVGIHDELVIVFRKIFILQPHLTIKFLIYPILFLSILRPILT